MPWFGLAADGCKPAQAAWARMAPSVPWRNAKLAAAGRVGKPLGVIKIGGVRIEWVGGCQHHMAGRVFRGGGIEVRQRHPVAQGEAVARLEVHDWRRRQTAATSVTTAFADDLPGQTLLYETDFTEAAGWGNVAGTGAGYIRDGVLSTDRDNGTSGPYLTLGNAAVLGAPLNLEVAEETTTAIYFKAKFGGNSGDNRIVFRFRSSSEGDLPNLGVRLRDGTSSPDTFLGLSDSQYLSTGSAFSTSLDGVSVSTDESVPYRLMMNVVAETATLNLRFDQYEEAAKTWNPVGAIAIPDYNDTDKLGGKSLDRLSVFFQSSGESVSDLAVTQSSPPVPVLAIEAAIPMYVSASEPAPLLRAVEDLQRDLRDVMGVDFPITHDEEILAQGPAIVVIGPSADVSIGEDRWATGWEAHRVFVEANGAAARPFTNIISPGRRAARSSWVTAWNIFGCGSRG